MSLTAQAMYELLQPFSGALYGNRDAEIHDVMLWNGRHNESADSLIITEEYIDWNGHTASCLQVPRNESGKVLQQIQQFLTYDYRRSSLIVKMLPLLSKPVGPEDVALCAQIMNNPVWMLDANFKPVIQSTALEGVTDSAFSSTDAYMIQSPLLIEADATCAYRRILSPIIHQGQTTGYLTVFESTPFIHLKMDMCYTAQLCELLSPRKRKSERSLQMNSIETFIMKILRGQMTDEVAIHQRLKDLHWQESDKYYVLSVPINTAAKTEEIAKDLCKVLHTKIYVLNRCCVSILDCPLEKNLSALDFPLLEKLLLKHGLYAGLSNGFLDLTTLRQAFNQSIASIPLRQRFSENVRLARYEDLTLIHLIDTASKNGIPLQSLCHPLVVNICNYDQKNNTDYLRTLSAYVLNNMSIQKASDALFIHRNTMHYRVNQLKEKFHIDFDNARLFMKLRISVSIYSYLGHVKLTSLWGPLD